MPADVQVRSLTPEDAFACDEVIQSLPYHFGDPQGREDCAKAVRTHAGIAAIAGERIVGFLTWKPWFDSACEITWMAVHAESRGVGIGTLLVDRFAAHAREQRLRFLLVTTLSPSVVEPGVDDGYERTRSFYVKQGFVPTWEPEGWWNERNQALLMVQPLE